MDEFLCEFLSAVVIEMISTFLLVLETLSLS